ncbi:MAG: NAD-dependent epimerase [Candidatus Thermoplasmatota archaeon]|nr:NAD-dependent epimerase [Candidatus Thermoplasmatota archaeon]
MPKILVTGSAGFIGFHVSKYLLERGYAVIGYDNLNPYYDPSLKRARLKMLKRYPTFTFHKADLRNRKRLFSVFEDNHLDKVCHLAAQAGVRYSIESPHTYIDSNIVGTMNILEACRQFKVKDLVYASSSSVYGGNEKTPFSEEDRVDDPISLYAATKKSNELMAHVYSHLFGLNTTGLRFFTVYGPYGRPDMALFKFAKNIIEDRPIEVFNYGNMERDFTYIDDIVKGTVAALDRPFKYEVFNLGNNKPIKLTYFIELIEQHLGKKAQRQLLPMQEGDVPRTCADIDHAKELLGYDPKVSIEDGVSNFLKWYLDHYKC